MEKKNAFICTEAELELIKLKIEELKNEIFNIVSDKSFETSVHAGNDACVTAVIDLEELQRKRTELLRYASYVENAAIIEQNNDTSVDVGDVVTIAFDEDDFMNVRLVANVISAKSVDGISETSLQSPLGKALYRKNLGDTVSYNAFNGEVECKITGLLKSNKDKRK